MKTEHTNGPWKAYLYGKDAHGRTIATVGANDGNNRICEISPYDLPLSDVAANARLIAAAPELLHALKCLVRETSFLIHGDGTNGAIVANEIRNAIATIVKAKGNA